MQKLRELHHYAALLLLPLLIGLAHGGCNTFVKNFGSKGGGVDPSHHLLAQFKKSAQLRTREDLKTLVRLFSDQCLYNSHGFRLEYKRLGGGFEQSRWIKRKQRGTLVLNEKLDHGLGDLLLTLASFQQIERVEFSPIKTKRFKTRAIIRARLVIRGIARQGALKIESGLVDLDIVKRGGKWKIDRFDPIAMHSLIQHHHYEALTDKNILNNIASDSFYRLIHIKNDLALIRVNSDKRILIYRPNEKNKPHTSGEIRANARAIDTADLNQDGQTDLLVLTNHGVEIWLQNDNDFKRFKEIQYKGLTSFALVDLNKKRSIDIYGASPHGDIEILDILEKTTIRKTNKKHQKVCAIDIDGDGQLEFFLSSKNTTDILHYQKRRYQRFQSIKLGLKKCAFGDINNDGLLDALLIAKNAKDNTASGSLFLSQKKGPKLKLLNAHLYPEENAQFIGGDFIDLNRDGFSDLWIRLRKNEEIENRLLLNTTRNQFAELSAPPANQRPNPLAFDQAMKGQLDLIETKTYHLDSSQSVLGDDDHQARAIICLKGFKETIKSARIEIFTAQGKQIRTISQVSGWPNGPAQCVHLGLGNALRIQVIRLILPSGKIEIYEDLPVDKEIWLAKNKQANWNNFKSKQTLAKHPPKKNNDRIATSKPSSLDELHTLLLQKKNTQRYWLVINHALNKKQCDTLKPIKNKLRLLYTTTNKPCAFFNANQIDQTSKQSLQILNALLPAIVEMNDIKIINYWVISSDNLKAIIQRLK